MTAAPDVIAITEVNPKNSRFGLHPAEYQIDGYEAFSSLGGRGIIIWIRNGIEASPYRIQPTYEDSLWLKIKISKTDSLLLGCVYRSPNSSDENNESLNNLFRSLPMQLYSHLLVCGDFNYPSINWETNSTNEPNAQKFLESCDDAYVHQHIEKPTRARLGQCHNVLDLVFSNEENMVGEIAYESPLGKSDHSCLVFEFRCYLIKGLAVQIEQSKYFIELIFRP